MEDIDNEEDLRQISEKEDARKSILDRISLDAEDNSARVKLFARRFGIEPKKEEVINVSFLI